MRCTEHHFDGLILQAVNLLEPLFVKGLVLPLLRVGYAMFGNRADTFILVREQLRKPLDPLLPHLRLIPAPPRDRLEGSPGNVFGRETSIQGQSRLFGPHACGGVN